MNARALCLGAAATIAALALGGPARAAAQNLITDARLELGEAHFELRVEAREALGEPRVRSSEGFVRVWFPHMAGASIDREGDGHAIRFVRVRPGYEDTAVTIIRLGDMRTVPEGRVTVIREGAVARIRIARSELPGVPEVVTAPPAEAAQAAAPAEPTAEEAETEALAAEPPPAAEADAIEEASAPTAEPSPLALTRREATPIPTPEGMSTTTTLVLLTLLLGAGYLALRTWQKKTGRRGPRRDIEIVAQKRIGARNQLLVVRALGEDHLLALHAGKAEKLASLPSPSADDDEDGEPENDLLPFLRLGGGRKDVDPPSAVHRDRADRGGDLRPRFGAELLRAAAERPDRVTVGAASAASTSEAVAGLLRLREKLGR